MMLIENTEKIVKHEVKIKTCSSKQKLKAFNIIRLSLQERLKRSLHEGEKESQTEV